MNMKPVYAQEIIRETPKAYEVLINSVKTIIPFSQCEYLGIRKNGHLFTVATWLHNLITEAT